MKLGTLELDGTEDGDIVEIELGELIAKLDVGGGESPTDGEAAAIATAIGAHLTDCAVAAERARSRAKETVDEWAFLGRAERTGRTRRRRPRSIERGREWQAMSRSV